MIIFQRYNLYIGKIKTHVPIVKIEINKITVINCNPIMIKRYYIVKHTLVSHKGDILGERIFYPEDNIPKSTFPFPEYYIGKNLCNKFLQYL